MKKRLALLAMATACIAGRAQINNPSSGITQFALVPAESFGAVGDWNGTTGTDNTTALQNAINSIESTNTCGQVLLQAKSYKVTGTLLINKSCVGIRGTGIVETNTSLFLNPSPGSLIISTSASADILDVWGADAAHNVYGNALQNFTVARSVLSNSGTTGPPATGPAGISMKYSYGAIVDHVNSEDSGFGFYFHAVGSGGVGYFNNDMAQYGYRGLTETTGQYNGFWFDSANGEPSPSVRMTNNFVASNGLNPNGPNILGLVLSGSAYNDMMSWNFETAGVNYGIFINTTGATGIGAQDIHFRNAINDADNFSCIYISGATPAMTSTIDVDGGWCEVQGQSSPGIHIIGSNNVVVRGVQIHGNSAMNWGILADTTPNSNISIVNNNLLVLAGGISIVGGSDYNIKDNLINGAGSGTLLSLTGSPAHVALGGNVYSGTGTGVSIAAGTTDVKGLESDVFDTTLTNTIISAIPFLNPPLGTETVAYSATPTLSNIYKASAITLTGSITSFTLAAGVDGQPKTLTFCQNATGNFTVGAPANVHGLTAVGATASKCSQQSFTYSAGQSAWLSNGTGTINQ